MVRRRHDDEKQDVQHVQEEATKPEDAGAEAGGQDVTSLLAQIDAIKAELEEARQAAAEERDRRLRVMADFSNYKRRREEESRRYSEFATQELILKLLPVIDNFERAALAAEQAENFDALAEGVELTLRQIRDILEKEGVQPIKAVGEPFDPMMHEAVMRIDTEDYPDNTVVEEVEKGYTLKGRIIRPSRVVVATTQ